MLKKIINLLSSKRSFQEIEKLERKLTELEGAIERLEKTAPEELVQEQIEFYYEGKYMHEKDADKVCIEILKIFQKYKINFGLSKMILTKAIDLMEDNSFVNIENE
ncbi:hypothetical protein ACQPUQ_16955 [Clostridium paraputrificum]|uniref:hypothetical protein n=1 Tax=Clostridium paraputrificum TaxID=29363 RepID=UPI003D341E9D